MIEMNPLKDASFLRKLDRENLKTFYVKIIILNKDELPLRAIEGRVSAGSISIDGSSSVRRSGSITFLAEQKENDLTDVDNLLSINKKIKILVGMENNIDDHYDKVVWFNQGIFVITQPSISHNTGGVTINLQFKDKMCLLNGDCGGTLPASVTFDSYDQIIGFDNNNNKGYETFPDEPNNFTIYEIRRKKEDSEEEIVGYYMWDSENGWSPAQKSLVGTRKNVPQKIFDIIQTLVCNYGGESIDKIIIEDVPLTIKQTVRYSGSDTLYYDPKDHKYQTNPDDKENWIPFDYNEDCGYIYTDFTYPGELVSSIGENVCSILDKIKNQFNYEYFYDIDGNFVFREIRNYLNTQYDPVQPEDKSYSLSDTGFLINNQNYYVDFSGNNSSVYTFEDGSNLISAYSNTPNYLNIKNDYHIWGKNKDNLVIHYHLAIKEKPLPPYMKRKVVYIENGKIRLAKDDDTDIKDYTPKDWRVEMYIRGLEKKARQERPNMHEQELLDLFDGIYNMQEQRYKTDISNNPNNLNYWIDYLDPLYDLHDISIESIGQRTYTYQKDGIKKLYDTDKPDVIMIDNSLDTNVKEILERQCEYRGQLYSHINGSIYNNISIGTFGYTAQETARDILYRYTDFMSSISITSIPIYYLDANVRITVKDRISGINGDYVIKTINLPLDAKSTMTISATKALQRV